MMANPVLVVMAAGMGSRYGGLKQIDPVGPNGQIIMNYSIYDAWKAGFRRVVFIIKEELLKAFQERIGNAAQKLMQVDYVFQSLDRLPEGCSVPADRTKPLGTGHAIYCVRGVVNEPFAVINADDYYGKEAFVRIHDFLVNAVPSPDKFRFCMAGFILKNTLSENGGVTRGLCEVDDQNHLTAIKETRNIIKTPEGAAVLGEGGHKEALSPDTHVSMNMWGFTPDILELLASGFSDFLSRIPEGNLTAEYLLPTIVDDLLKKGQAEVTMLETTDKWFGVTYKEDKEAVVEAIRALIRQGLYQ